MKRVFSQKDINLRIKLIDEGLFILAKYPRLKWQHSSILEHKLLLKCQYNLKDKTDSNPKLLQRYSMKKALLGSSLHETLLLTTIFNNMSKKDNQISLIKMAQIFNVTLPRMTLVELHGHAALGNWKAVDKLAKSQKKKLINKNSKSKEIPIEHFAAACYEFNGPQKYLTSYIDQIKDFRVKYNLCMRYYLYNEALNVAAYELKDQVMLNDLRVFLVENYGIAMSNLVSQIDGLFRDESFKWKRIR